MGSGVLPDFFLRRSADLACLAGLALFAGFELLGMVLVVLLPASQKQLAGLTFRGSYQTPPTLIRFILKSAIEKFSRSVRFRNPKAQPPVISAIVVGQ